MKKYNKRIYVDIDDTICYYEDGNKGDYSKALPYKDRIEQINKLYEEGNHITYWTARGTQTGIFWLDVTIKQFEKWGVKYHAIRDCKPVYDMYIDDKSFNAESFFKK